MYSTPVETVLDVQNLKTYFYVDGAEHRAVNDVSFTVRRGETLGIVGESGSGKSVTCMSLVQLLNNTPAKIVGGTALFEGEDTLTMKGKRLQQLRGGEISVIFQEPMTALNPLFTIGDQLTEALHLHRRVSKAAAWESAVGYLSRVGIPNAELVMKRYPFTLSGGMRQRVVIAMALIAGPKLIIADEPTTALDVTIQAQILDMLNELKDEEGCSIIFISHDLGAMNEMADRVLVMYGGRIVEAAPKAELFADPRHPYTRSLIDSHPGASQSGDRLKTIPGTVPSLANMPGGCPFQTRCAFATAQCAEEFPEPTDLGGEHVVSCWNLDAVARADDPAEMVVADSDLAVEWDESAEPDFGAELMHAVDLEFSPELMRSTEFASSAELVRIVDAVDGGPAGVDLRTHGGEAGVDLGVAGGRAGADDIRILRAHERTVLPAGEALPSAADEPLVRASNLVKHFPVGDGLFRRSGSFVHAVDDVSFQIPKSKVLGLVGESGSGKSTVGRLLMGFLASDSGEIAFGGRDVANASRSETFELTRRRQMVFQDPFSSMNPRMRVREIVGEGLAAHRMARGGSELRDMVDELLVRCGLGPEASTKYPHQFSGGQRQRIAIARALATNPEFIVCDEAVSALDVSVQAQIVNLLKDLQEDMGLTYLFISHDLNVVRFVSDEVLVMYLGEIIERGTNDQIFGDARHPYTQALLSAVPAFTADEKSAEGRMVLRGDIPSPIDPPVGCRFAGRCPFATELCRVETPRPVEVEPGHVVSCVLAY
ncbi:ABC transporter ATP-binding protein [Microbacterium sp. SSM24]|uniref:ABC transporter ATP-binding protein n=1 Tax=Microbacterium sp. SSM24 TaxID=2991714 RepID=UPI002227147E|nr:ABC transporter ATP-binding protein [Microbacterium sp. SSM24]MCW3492611.1 ABC transporter ATP-binding protein [Microbacterium sp. SSM24]